MRCLTLAECLRDEDHTVLFVCRDLPGTLSAMVEEKGFVLKRLPAAEHPTTPVTTGRYDSWLAVDPARDVAETIEAIGEEGADWLVVDHYGIDARWEKKIRPHVSHILVIDDLANRTHDCDLLTEQNYRAEASARYAGLTPHHCRHLIGPDYALLQPSFARLRSQAQPRTDIDNILVFYGGIDATNETDRALGVLESIRDFNGVIDVVVGSANTRRKQIERRCEEMETVRFHCQTKTMAELMLRADLALGAGGVTSWERCCLGLPTIVTAVAENQIDIARTVADMKAGWYAGTAAEVTGERLWTLVQRAMSEPELLAEASQAALKLGDGCGTERIRNEMMAFAEAGVAQS